MAQRIPTPAEVEAAISADVTGRVLLPTVCFARNLAQSFPMTEEEAEAAIEAGAFGPRVRIGGRWAVLKESLLDHLAGQATLPEVAGEPRRDRGRLRRLPSPDRSRETDEGRTS